MKPDTTPLVHVVSVWAFLQALGAILLGTSILLGGPGRFTVPSLLIAAQLAPWCVWGAVYILTGLLHGWAVLERRPSVLSTGLVVACIHGLFAGSLLWSVLKHDTVPGTGATTYAGLAVMTTVGAHFARLVYADRRTSCSPR